MTYEVNLTSARKAPVNSRAYWWEIYRPIRECLRDQVDKKIIQHIKEIQNANSTLS